MLVDLFTPVALTIKKNFVGLPGTAVSWLAVITGEKVQSIESWLRIGSYAGAIVVSAVTVWTLLRRDRRESTAK